MPSRSSVLSAPALRVVVAALLAAALTAAAAVVWTDHGGRRAGRAPIATADLVASTTYRAPKLRLVQANLRIGTPVRRFQADVRKVLGTHPDFVTYQEVAHRHNSVLAPGAYRIWRSSGVYRGETAVAWNSHRWHAIGHGTTMLTNKKGHPAGVRYDWGVRYANWVTLKNGSGLVVSVIAAHFPPQTKYTRGLTAPAARRLGSLADHLGKHGPVLVGGDLNVGFHSKGYPRTILKRHRLISTYDVLQKRAVTSGSDVTLDYLLVRGVSRFAINHQFVLGLNSDHNAVGANFGPLPPTIKSSNVHFATGTAISDGTGSTRDKRVILRTAIKAIRSARSGASIHLAVARLDSTMLVGALLSAHRRHVHVHVITGGPATATGSAKLARQLGHKIPKRDWMVERPGAFDKLSRSTLLINRTGATPAFRLTSDWALGPGSNGSWKRAVLSTTKKSYDRLFRSYFAAVGQKVG